MCNTPFSLSFSARALCKAVLVLMALRVLVLPARAEIILSGGVNTTGASFQITSDIHLPIIKTGLIGNLILDEWVKGDGGSQTVTISSAPLKYQINGGPLVSSFGALTDNAFAATNAITLNDGLLTFKALNVTAGDVFTIKAGSWTTFVSQSAAGFNPRAAGTFTGNVFLVGYEGIPMSATVAVPEPAGYIWCLVTGWVGWQLYRGRKLAVKC